MQSQSTSKMLGPISFVWVFAVFLWILGMLGGLSAFALDALVVAFTGEHVKSFSTLWEWLYSVLADARLGKVFHNGVVYDVPILQGIGFHVRGRLIDTMNLAHACYPELSKGLQFTATLYNWAPVWKVLSDETDEGDGKG